ncbi:MAG: YicC family protein [Bacteroidia bacterium]|nr:YicC family protein [Bacteroidia bacterium]
MIQSMTGYGSATCSSPNFNVTVEIKSLNSKFLEFQLKLPRVYMKYEHKLRTSLSKNLQRGKVTLLLNVEVLTGDKRTLNINKSLVKKYHQELTDLADFLDIPAQVNMDLLLNLPEVIPTEVEHEDPEEWQLIERAAALASAELVKSRKEEGQALDRDLVAKVGEIRKNLEEVKSLAPRRLENVRSRIEQSLEEIKHKVEADPNRFEQELIFYMEKYDINEEIVRLTQHIQYFEELRATDKSNGKQLQFLSQEMGREINTIGSKANDAQIQRHVVKMKDELEKIKEQVLNIL